jgi:pilus assembly protein FimV
MGSRAGGHVGQKPHMNAGRSEAGSIQRLRVAVLRTSVALACGTLLSFSLPSSVLALDLGDITLSSTLNEPLSASIAFDSYSGGAESDITVRLGDPADYNALTILRDPLIDDIRVSIELDSADAGRIILSSTLPVVEPFLNLIVFAAEPGGADRKDYTLLLELPTNGAPTQAAASPAAQQAAAPAVTAAAGAGAQSYTVGSGDTLWEIASRTRPDSSVSVQQMMVAIQRANPDAFRNGNINTLLSGRVLRIPSQQDIAVIDRQAAVAQVAQQGTNLGGQPLVAGNSGAGGNAASRDQLRLLSGDAAVPAANGGGSDLAATIAALESELMLSEESLDRARLQNLELNNRLAALQEQIDLLENIIAMEDDRIATLQAELVRQAEATAQALASAENTAAALADLNNEQPAGVSGLLRNGVVMLGAAVAVMLAALGFLVHRRRQAQLEAEANQFNPAFVEVDEDTVAVDDEPKPGLLAGLMARLRRDRDSADDYEDDYEDEDHPEPVAGAAAYAATAAAQDSTDRLRGEMGLDEDLASLDNALNDIDERGAAPVDVFEPLVDDEPSLGDASDMAPAVEAEADAEQERDDDYAQNAADAAFAAIDTSPEAPETIAFTPAVEPEPLAAVADDDDDLPETFEFTLKDLPDLDNPVPAADEGGAEIETFNFTPVAPVLAPEPEVATAAEPVEVIAFPGASSTPATLLDDDLSLELGDLSFDDTTLVDDEEEDSPYKPRTGNECDTKLDLATAYEAMGDVVEAIEILDEVIAEGSPEQVETAQRLKDTWQATL